MARKKQPAEEPNLLTQRFAQGPPPPKQHEGIKKRSIFVAIILLLVVALIAVQFVQIDTGDTDKWAEATEILAALKENPLDKKALAALGNAVDVIDDTEVNREARTGLLTVYTLGLLRVEARGASYTQCKDLRDRYPESSFAKLLTEDKLCKKMSRQDAKCPVCKGSGKRSKLNSLTTSSGSGTLGKSLKKCISCAGTGKKRGFDKIRLDKDKVRSQYDEARSQAMKLAVAKKSIGTSLTIVSKLQFFKGSSSEEE